MPADPPGDQASNSALRRLGQAMRDLHAAAGRPSLRMVSQRVKEGGHPGTASIVEPLGGDLARISRAIRALRVEDAPRLTVLADSLHGIVQGSRHPQLRDIDLLLELREHEGLPVLPDDREALERSYAEWLRCTSPAMYDLLVHHQNELKAAHSRAERWEGESRRLSAEKTRSEHGKAAEIQVFQARASADSRVWSPASRRLKRRTPRCGSSWSGQSGRRRSLRGPGTLSRQRLPCRTPGTPSSGQLRGSARPIRLPLLSRPGTPWFPVRTLPISPLSTAPSPSGPLRMRTIGRMTPTRGTPPTHTEPTRPGPATANGRRRTSTTRHTTSPPPPQTVR